jgi:hypothetical protein
MRITTLELVTTAVTSTTGTFKLAASLGLSTDVRSSVFAVNSSEMSNRLAGITRTSQQQGVGTSGSLNSQLIESHNLTASLDDSAAGRFSESKSANVDLGNVQQANVVSDGADNNGDSLLVLALQEFGDTGQGKRRTVHSAHHQSLEDDLVELGFSSAGQESVKLKIIVRYLIVLDADYR